MSLQSPDLSASKTGSCPHLGVEDDPQTCLAYPAQWNLCYRAKPVAAVSLEQQRVLCLSPVYARCPVFQRERRGPLPKQFRMARGPARLRWVLLAFLLLLAGLGLWAAWRYRPAGAFPLLAALPLPFATGGATIKISAPEATATPLVLGAFTRTPFPATFSPPAPKPGPSLTPTALKQCGYTLETRFEVDGQVLSLHKVRRGESMDMLATNYETSLGAMQALNYFLPSPLWAELVIVIPVGGLTGEGLTVLEPYQVSDPGASLAGLAGQFSITTQELILANALDEGCQTVSGWVLVPHQARKSP